MNSGQLDDLLSVLNGLSLFEYWLDLKWSLCGFVGTVQIDEGGVGWLEGGLVFVGFDLFFELQDFLLEFLDVELFSLPGLFGSEFGFFGFLLDFSGWFLESLKFGWVLVGRG